MQDGGKVDKTRTSQMENILLNKKEPLKMSSPLEEILRLTLNAPYIASPEDKTKDILGIKEQC